MVRRRRRATATPGRRPSPRLPARRSQRSEVRDTASPGGSLRRQEVRHRPQEWARSRRRRIPSRQRSGVRRPGVSGGPRRRRLGGRRLSDNVPRRAEGLVEIDRRRVEVGRSVAVDCEQVAELLPDPLSRPGWSPLPATGCARGIGRSGRPVGLGGRPRWPAAPHRRTGSVPARAAAASTISATMA